MDDPTIKLVLDTIDKKKQALVFANTKNSAEKTAEDISKQIKKSSPELIKLAEDALKAIGTPTKQCKRLAICLKKGIAFHHAGLTYKQKDLIEDNFKAGLIKIICATPTLCISRDTNICYGTSEIPIKKVNKYHSIFVLSNNKLICMKPQKIEINNNDSKLIEITSVSGYSIKVTKNHKMLIKRNNKKLTIKAENISKTDKIATIGNLHVEKIHNPSIHDFIIDNKKPTINYRFG